MTVQRTVFAAALLLSFLLLGCGVPAVEGDGRVEHVTRTVAPFTEVDAESSLDVEIRQGTDFEVELHLDPKRADDVSTRVEDGRLVIVDVATDPRSRSADSDEALDAHVGGPEVIVTMPELSRAVLGGSGLLTVASWGSDAPITLVLSGSSDLDAHRED